jgi:hypothetical protein
VCLPVPSPLPTTTSASGRALIAQHDGPSPDANPVKPASNGETRVGAVITHLKGRRLGPCHDARIAAGDSAIGQCHVAPGLPVPARPLTAADLCDRLSSSCGGRDCDDAGRFATLVLSPLRILRGRAERLRHHHPGGRAAPVADPSQDTRRAHHWSSERPLYAAGSRGVGQHVDQLKRGPSTSGCPLSPAAQPVAASQPDHCLLPALHGNASYLRGQWRRPGQYGKSELAARSPILPRTSGPSHGLEAVLRLVGAQ